MHFIMGHDITRRFVFGLTVEQRKARLYFACRSFIAVSEEFDLDKVCSGKWIPFLTVLNDLQDWKEFVKVTLSFAFGSAEELGWDSTMVKRNGQQDIQVAGKWYTITKTLSNFKAFSILGRSTRIYLATDKKTGEEAVIKDLWADAARDSEGEIQKRLKAELEGHCRKEYRKTAGYLFTHRDSWDVRTASGSTDTTAGISRQLKMEGRRLFRIRPLRNPAKRINSAGSMGSQHDPMTIPASPGVSDSGVGRAADGSWNIPNRKHHRLVIGEHATPLQDLKDLKECIQILEELIHCECPSVL
jgi:hypothetical protein